MEATRRDSPTPTSTSCTSSSSSSSSRGRKQRLICLECCYLVVVMLFLPGPVRAFFFSSPSPSSTRLQHLQPSRPASTQSMVCRRTVSVSNQSQEPFVSLLSHHSRPVPPHPPRRPPLCCSVGGRAPPQRPTPPPHPAPPPLPSLRAPLPLRTPRI